MKTAYLAKPVRDGNGTITGYNVQHAFSSKILSRPRGDYEILFGDRLYRFKKAEQVDGEWKVTEDTAAKTAFKTPKQRIQAATTIAQLKVILLDLYS